MKRCKVFLFSQLSPDNYFIIPKRKASFDFILLDFGVILVVNVKNYKSNCIEKMLGWEVEYTSTQKKYILENKKLVSANYFS